MANYDVQFSTPPQNTPPSDPYSAPLTVPSDNGEVENPDDWEYEYSNTETEIYYVTLDLSIPQDSRPQDTRHAPEKQRTTGIWVDPSIKISEKNAKRMKGNTNRSRKPNAEEEDQDMEVDEHLPGEIPVKKFPFATPAITAPEEKPAKPTKVQILDLHSKQPVISYGGQIFAAEWKKNIGTEFLFTGHDPEDPLPVVKNLSDDVDLIAASSIRLQAKPLELERKFTMRRPDATGDGTAPGYHQKRRDQTDFLNNLDEIKKQKGEDDRVTMVLKALPVKDSVWRTELMKRRNQEKTRLRKIIKEDGDVEEVEKAQEKLAVMEKDDAKRKTTQAPKKKNQRKSVPAPSLTPTSTPAPTMANRRTSMARRSKGQSQTPIMETSIPQAMDGGMDEDDDDDYEDDEFYDDEAIDEDTQMDDVY